MKLTCEVEKHVLLGVKLPAKELKIGHDGIEGRGQVSGPVVEVMPFGEGSVVSDVVHKIKR